MFKNPVTVYILFSRRTWVVRYTLQVELGSEMFMRLTVAGTVMDVTFGTDERFNYISADSTVKRMYVHIKEEKFYNIFSY